MTLHREIRLEDEICGHLAAHGWLYEPGHGAAFAKERALFPADVLAWVQETQAKYRAGQIGDVDCKKKLVEVLNAIIEPIRTRRATYEKDPGEVLRILKAGTAKANGVAEETLYKAKGAMKQDFFPRTLTL